jgi:hypothetical protein
VEDESSSDDMLYEMMPAKKGGFGIEEVSNLCVFKGIGLDNCLNFNFFPVEIPPQVLINSIPGDLFLQALINLLQPLAFLK